MLKIIHKYLICLLVLVMPLMNTDSKAMFSDDPHDMEGNIVVRALQRVSDIDLSNHITLNIAPSVRAVNLINQGLITDQSLTFLENNCPNLTFLNVENTGVTPGGINNFSNIFPNIKIHHSTNN